MTATPKITIKQRRRVSPDLPDTTPARRPADIAAAEPKQPAKKKKAKPAEPAAPVVELTPEELAAQAAAKEAEAAEQAAAKVKRDRQKLEQSAINVARFLKSQSLMLVEKLNQLPFDNETNLAEEIHGMIDQLTEYLIIAVENNQNDGE